MIPKIIHYCWFGGNPLPESAKKCIASWKKYFPDYKIMEWNESNFDIHVSAYVEEAYKEKKWAFVSDYARFWIIYRYGGLYFDTDVEVIRPFDEILASGPFMGCEYLLDSNFRVGVNPGLGLGAEAGMSFYKELLDFYKNIHFLNDNGEQNKNTIVDYTSLLLGKHGWVPDNSIQNVAGITIYPSEYFCPLDYMTGKLTITKHTFSIHHYTASWLNSTEELIIKISIFFTSHLGKKIGHRVARVIDFPLRVKNKIDILGFIRTIYFALNKCRNVFQDIFVKLRSSKNE